jgi:hypothetical protein
LHDKAQTLYRYLHSVQVRYISPDEAFTYWQGEKVKAVSNIEHLDRKKDDSQAAAQLYEAQQTRLLEASWMVRILTELRTNSAQ